MPRRARARARRRRPCPRRMGSDARRAARASLLLPLSDGALVAGHVADKRLANQEVLVARLALLRLTGGGGVRVRVGVQVVLRGRAVRRRARRSALVVRPLRRRNDDEALPGSVAVALRQVASDVAEPERYVVTRRLRRSDEIEWVTKRDDRLLQPVDAARHDRVRDEAIERVEDVR